VDGRASDPWSALYIELRALARGVMQREHQGHTLQTTALVHEAWMRLRGDPAWASRAHFLATAARTMRRVLVDHARAKGRLKRDGGSDPLPIVGGEGLADLYARAVDMLALDAALDRLAAHSELGARIVELRFFAGMAHPEIAEVCGVSQRTVERTFRLARAYLYRDLGDASGSERA
jgi:RNA polymerase sigma factor (TIGR02999 family)